MKTLRREPVGAWKPVSYVDRPTDGSEPVYPMGRVPQGLVPYTPDGTMSAQPRHPGRSEFASGDRFRGTRDEIEAEASGDIAHSRPFHADEERRHLTHTMLVSLFPNWLGQTHPRVVEIAGDALRLSTAAPIRSGGRETMSYLTWRRTAPGS